MSHLGPKKTYQEIRDHFIQRLKERYNLEITQFEYDKLAQSVTNKNLIYNINSYNRLILLEIKGTPTYCLYGKQNIKKRELLQPAKLITCFDPKRDFPVPKLLKHKLSKQAFEKEVNNLIKHILTIAEGNKTDKEIFSLPDHNIIKTATHKWIKHGNIELEYLSYYLQVKHQADSNTSPSTNLVPKTGENH